MQRQLIPDESAAREQESVQKILPASCFCLPAAEIRPSCRVPSAVIRGMKHLRLLKKLLEREKGEFVGGMQNVSFLGK